jgi:hypothetical protein
MNELEEIEALNNLIKQGFVVFIKTKYGLKEVVSIEKKNGLVITKLKNGIEVVEAPKVFMKRTIIISPKSRNPSQVPPVEEIYNYLSTKKGVYYRGRKVTKMTLSGKVLILELEEGYQTYATPSDMLEYAVYVEGK